MSYGKLAETLIKTAKEYKGAAINLVIIGGTVALKKVVESEKFHCPCVGPEQLIECESGSEFYSSVARCTKPVNLHYGLSHIVFPAIALYFIGMFVSVRLWKVVTGCSKARPRARRQRKRAVWPIVVSVNVKAVLAPFTWLIVMLLDGKYLSCAVTPFPYDVGTGKTYETCNDVAKADEGAYTSDAFQTNEIMSQVFGWFVFALATCIGFLAYLITRCSSPMTYYHAKYYQIYKENEEYEIDDEMKIKAQADAEANVRRFMADRRTKEEWDEISQVSEYKADKRHMSVWSCMHQWVLDDQCQVLPKKRYETIAEASGGESPTKPLLP